MECCRCGVRIAPYCADCSVMTVAEAMTRLRCSRDTIQRWIKAGKLTPLRKVHRRVLIRRAEIEALLR
jgi:excisionase family DNA binding protein